MTLPSGQLATLPGLRRLNTPNHGESILMIAQMIDNRRVASPKNLLTIRTHAGSRFCEAPFMQFDGRRCALDVVANQTKRQLNHSFRERVPFRAASAVQAVSH